MSQESPYLNITMEEKNIIHIYPLLLTKVHLVALYVLFWHTDFIWAWKLYTSQVFSGFEEKCLTFS